MQTLFSEYSLTHSQHCKQYIHGGGVDDMDAYQMCLHMGVSCLDVAHWPQRSDWLDKRLAYNDARIFA